MAMAQTWNAAPPPALPAPSLAGKVAGALRLGAIIVLTLLVLGVFLIGRTLRGFFGRGVTFHFEVVRRWSVICLALCGLRLRVQGEPVAAGALVANHSTWLDILVLRAVRLIYFVSKAEVAHWPVIGFITRVTGTIFIDRRRTEAKRQEALLRSRIAHDQLLCFFPEGTSTDGQRVLPFKTSLFSVFWKDGEATTLPVQPVTIRYNPPSGLPASFFGWWGEMSFERSIWSVVTLSRGALVDVIFHPPVVARDFEGRKELALHCRTAVVAGVERGVPAPCAGARPAAAPEVVVERIPVGAGE